jgi:hypothetical protein
MQTEAEITNDGKQNQSSSQVADGSNPNDVLESDTSASAVFGNSEDKEHIAEPTLDSIKKVNIDTDENTVKNTSEILAIETEPITEIKDHSNVTLQSPQTPTDAEKNGDISNSFSRYVV